MDNVICNTVAAALDELDLHYTIKGETFIFSIGDELADFPIRIIANEKDELLLVIGYFPVKVGRQHLEQMYQIINDMNYSSFNGTFVIDSSDGELSLRVANNVDGGAVNVEIVKVSLLMVVARLRNKYDEIMKAMFGGPQMNFTFATEDGSAAS